MATLSIRQADKNAQNLPGCEQMVLEASETNTPNTAPNCELEYPTGGRLAVVTMILWLSLVLVGLVL